MFLFSKPGRAEVDSFLAAQAKSNFSYPEVGATTGVIPSGYNVDHNRQLLGKGMEAFARAKLAIQSWKMFDFPWVQLVHPDMPPESGQDVAILVRHYGFYSLSATRVVYSVAESSGDTIRFGFAYGTLLEHAEIGEERFSVEYHESSREVWYDLYAFSRPGSLLAIIGYPLSRHLQKQFARESKLAMLSAVSTEL